MFFFIIELKNIKTECENAVHSDFSKIRKAIDKREAALMQMINDKYNKKTEQLKGIIESMETKKTNLNQVK